MGPLRDPLKGVLSPPPHSSFSPWGPFGALREGSLRPPNPPSPPSGHLVGEPSPPSTPWGRFRALPHWCKSLVLVCPSTLYQYVKSIGQPSVNYLPGRNLYRRQREKSLAARNTARNIATSEFLAVGEKNVADSEKTSDISSEISRDISLDISLLFSLDARRPAII